MTISTHYIGKNYSCVILDFTSFINKIKKILYATLLLAPKRQLF